MCVYMCAYVYMCANMCPYVFTCTAMNIQVHIDAAAAKGIIERRGLSKVRHIDVNVLWLQEVCARKILPVDKVPGEDNPADGLTKHVRQELATKYAKTLNMKLSNDRASTGLQIANQ